MKGEFNLKINLVLVVPKLLWEKMRPTKLTLREFINGYNLHPNFELFKTPHFVPFI